MIWSPAKMMRILPPQHVLSRSPSAGRSLIQAGFAGTGEGAHLHDNCVHRMCVEGHAATTPWIISSFRATIESNGLLVSENGRIAMADIQQQKLRPLV